MEKEKLTHLDEQGHIRMVDVSFKPPTLREAIARGTISMEAKTLEAVLHHKVKKGNVFETAKIAGIMAAKKTFLLIPLCHQIQLTTINLDFFVNREKNSIAITSSVKTIERTGVEMEALLAVSVSALTIYDMCKAMDRGMKISDIILLKKSGGQSGTFVREGK